ncbi:MAG: transcriptional repressor LexA [Eubacteriales bacterium]|jgi:repressor LexA
MKVKRTLEDVEKKIFTFFRKNRRMPTYSEMAEIIGVRSKSVVDFWVKKLISAGVLQKDAKGFLAPARLSLALPLAGEVCAGFPSPAEEELRDVISFDEYLVNRPETSFLLSVTGDSMEGAGIMNKDLVIVERGREPKNGDIILAEVDGNWTMKYFCKKGKTVTLEAANPKYPPIIPKEELRIAGVITAVVRKYHK